MFSLNVYSQDDYDYWIIEQRTPDWGLKIFNEMNLNDSMKITNYVNPFYFEEDFNGDSYLDLAILVENLKSKKKGILIIHGEINELKLIGAGNEFEGFDDFWWMDVWKIHRNSKTHELTYKENYDIDGSRDINVHDPCLEIIKTESSSGLIYWKEKDYKWAQQSD